MLGKIFITGIGIFSTVGRNAEEVLYSLKNAGSGMGSMTQLDTLHIHQRIPQAILLQDNRTPWNPIGNTRINDRNKNVTHSLMLVSSC